MDGSIILRRSIFGRIVGGTPVQFVCLLALVMASLALHNGAHAAAAAAVMAFAAALWIIGLFAYAAADDRGLRWRAIIPHHFAWSEIEAISRVRNPVAIGYWSHGRMIVLVRVQSKNWVLWPASSLGMNAMEFTRQLAEIARGHNIATDLGPEGSGW